MNRKPAHSALFLVIFAVSMVSYSGPMVKGALQAGATPLSVALVRMFSAGLLLLPFDIRLCLKKRISFALNRSQFLWTLLASFLLAAHYLSWMTSLGGASTFASVSLVCTQPLFVAGFSYLLFRETLPRRAIPGAVLALLGALVIALAGLIIQPSASATTQESFWASILALTGAVVMAAHWLVARHIRQHLAAEVYTPVLYLFTGLILTLALPFLGGFHMPAKALPYMAGLILGSTLLGHALFTVAISRVSPSVISFALLGEPIGAMLFAVLLFHEIPSPWVLAGGGITLLGLCLYLQATASIQSQSKN